MRQPLFPGGGNFNIHIFKCTGQSSATISFIKSTPRQKNMPLKDQIFTSSFNQKSRFGGNPTDQLVFLLPHDESLAFCNIHALLWHDGF